MNTQENTDTYDYTEDDFIYQTSPWIDREASKLSKFDLELCKRWNKAMEAGVFRYGIDHIITRIIPGPKRYVGQLNTLRATERRKPQEISSIKQPFNEKAFSFTWVAPEEVIFNLRNVTPRKESTSKIWNSEASSWTEHQNNLDSAYCDKLTNGSLNGYLSVSLAGTQSSDTHTCNENVRHTLIVNVSPMENGHCLLVPEIDFKRPQVLTETSIRVAIETMLLSRHRGLRMGYNSLCAFASVNHLHFHLYYLEHELIVDHCPVHHLGGRYFEFTALPCPGFALQLYGTTVAEMARLVHKIGSYFHENDIAHNVFLCRGVVFGEERHSMLTTIRLFIWPRKKFIGNKSSEEFNVACIELAGHLPIKEVDGYHKLTESDVDAIIADACLPAHEYKNIRDAVTRMGLEEAEKLKRKL